MIENDRMKDIAAELNKKYDYFNLNDIIISMSYDLKAGKNYKPTTHTIMLNTDDIIFIRYCLVKILDITVRETIFSENCKYVLFRFVCGKKKLGELRKIISDIAFFKGDLRNISIDCVKINGEYELTPLIMYVSEDGYWTFKEKA